MLSAPNCRRVLHRSLAAWATFLDEARSRAYLESAAVLHYQRCLCKRALRRLFDNAREANARAREHAVCRRLRYCMAVWRAHILSTRSKTEVLKRTLLSVDAHARQTRDQSQRRPTAFPSTVTGALLPIGIHRHRADCAVTAALIKPLGFARLSNHILSSAEAVDFTTKRGHRMEEVQVRGGRTAQVPASCPRLGDRKSVEDLSLPWGSSVNTCDQSPTLSVTAFLDEGSRLGKVYADYLTTLAELTTTS